nr:MAG TPA: hypothetical protein [Caudoviricetes sp.]
MAYPPTPGASGQRRGLSYTRTMEWDPSKIQADTLLPDDPRLHIGTITADKVDAGSLNLGAALTEEQLALLRRTVMKGSS